MRTCVRVLTGIGLMLLLAVCLLSPLSYGGEKENDTIKKMAEAIEKGDTAGIKNGVAAAAPIDLLDIMTAFKKRTVMPPGIGFGPNPGVYNPDGIEAQVMNLAKKELPPAVAAKQKDDIVKAAYVAAAVAEMTAAKPPKGKNAAALKGWARWSDEMKIASKLLADAAAKGDPKSIKDAASKLNATCNNCHGEFRD